MESLWWVGFVMAVGLNLGAGVWNVLAARRHLRATAADNAKKKGDDADWLAGAYMKSDFYHATVRSYDTVLKKCSVELHGLPGLIDAYVSQKSEPPSLGVGAEVLVSFMGGDPLYPIVTSANIGTMTPKVWETMLADAAAKREADARWLLEELRKKDFSSRTRMAEFNQKIQALGEQFSLEADQAHRSWMAAQNLELLDLSSSTLHQAVVKSYDPEEHTCMVELPGRAYWLKVDVDYPPKSDPPILKEGMSVCMRFSPAIEGYDVL